MNCERICEQVQDNLSAYLDNALTAEEKAETEAHLASCPACRQAYQDLQATVQMLSSLEEEIPPAGFRRELYGKLQRERNVTQTIPLYRRLVERIRGINRYQLIPVAAVLLIMLVSLPLLMDSANLGFGKKSEVALEQKALDYDATYKTKESLRTAPAAAPDSVSGSGFASSSEESLRKTPTIDFNVMEQPQAPLDAGTAIDIERKIIKNADLVVAVESFDNAVSAIKDKVTAAGGYISSESGNAAGTEGIRNGHLQVRLPATQFEGFLTEIDNVGKVKSRHVYTQDVTEEYVDTESRLKALSTKEERLIAILANSGKLSDILAVENELANTRSQLESLQGRLRYLNNRTEYSSININVEQVTVSVQQISSDGLAGVLLKAKEAFITAVNNIIKDVGKLVVFISSALPYIILVAVVGYILWLVLKKRKQV